jgi:TRAP-type C4-dicarboxylate transport system substrate-binding protein
MTTLRTSAPAILAAIVLLGGVAACSSSPSNPTVSQAPSYSGTALTLTIGTDDSPGVPSTDQISHFASEVQTLSGGKITVEPRWHAEGNKHPADWDQAVARMVQAGHLDLGLGPTWAWDDLGVTSLRPLQAPFLVDSDPLTAQVVLDPGLSTKLRSGLAGHRVEGLSLWPEGMRHPFGFGKPLLTPADYAGTTIRSAKSTTIADVFKALGATTSPAEPDATTMAGLQGEYALKPNGIGAVNVTFFPKVNVLYGNAKTLAGLGDAARQVLATAAAETQKWAIEATSVPCWPRTAR